MQLINTGVQACFFKLRKTFTIVIICEWLLFIIAYGVGRVKKRRNAIWQGTEAASVAKARLLTSRFSYHKHSSNIFSFPKYYAILIITFLIEIFSNNRVFKRESWYVCTYVCTHTHTHIHIYVCIHTYICMYTYIHKHTHTHVYQHYCSMGLSLYT
jgi:hypothetical protein